MTYSNQQRPTEAAYITGCFSYQQSSKKNNREAKIISINGRNRKLSRDQEFIQTIYQVIDEKMDDLSLSVHDLCRAVFLSHTQAYRKIKAITGKTPTMLIRACRLEKAIALLQTTNESVANIAYEVGFSDPNYFSRAFQQEYNCTPSSIRG